MALERCIRVVITVIKWKTSILWTLKSRQKSSFRPIKITLNGQWHIVMNWQWQILKSTFVLGTSIGWKLKRNEEVEQSASEIQIYGNDSLKSYKALKPVQDAKLSILSEYSYFILDLYNFWQFDTSRTINRCKIRLGVFWNDLAIFGLVSSGKCLLLLSRGADSPAVSPAWSDVVHVWTRKLKTV